MLTMHRDDAVRLDTADPLRDRRDLFHLPDGLVYLDGNSLGAQPTAAISAAEVVLSEWGEQLIGGWRDAGWWELPLHLGSKLGPIVGADATSLLVCDTVTVNLYKTLNAALEMRPDRQVLLAEESGFPTDLYVARSVAARTGRELRLVPRGASIAEHLDESVAVALVNHLDFRTGELLDMPTVTEAVHAVGALALWDLSHTAGVIPMSLDASRVDFAVGCTYKYLNGGPGAPAYLYVNATHLAEASQPLQGWLGHADPFLMSNEYVPAPGVRRFLTGTQQIISMRVLSASLDAYADVDMFEVRAKSVGLTGLFIELVDERCDGTGLALVSPRNDSVRGSQVSLRHPDAVNAYDRIVDRGVRGDFRRPDILRFGFAPLYVSFADVWDAVDVLSAALRSS